jgi:hypothetical protein
MSIYRKLVLRFAILAALLVSLYGAVNASGPTCEQCLDEYPKCLDQCPKMKFPPPDGESCTQFCLNHENACLNECTGQ